MKLELPKQAEEKTKKKKKKDTPYSWDYDNILEHIEHPIIQSVDISRRLNMGFAAEVTVIVKGLLSDKELYELQSGKK